MTEAPGEFGLIARLDRGTMAPVGASPRRGSIAPLHREHRRALQTPGTQVGKRLGTVLAPGLGGILFGIDERLLWLSCLVLGIAAAALIALGPHRHAAHSDIEADTRMESVPGAS